MIYVTRQPKIQLLISILLLMAISCSRQVKEPPMPTKIPQTFSTTGTEPLPDSWWLSFKDDELNFLIEQALKDNFNLGVAWDRLAQVEAVAKKSKADLLPRADLEAGFRRSRQETGSSSVYSSLYALGIAAGYEVDLWSGIRSLRQAARLDVQAEQESLNTAAITLTASIASTWYQLAEAKDLVQIIKEQIETNKKVLDIVTVQFRKGKAAAADVLRQRQLVSSTEAQLILSEEQAELLQYQLSVLLGQKPDLVWQDATIELPELPPIPRLGVPSEVLWRRPDVRQDYRKVQASDQRLAAAIADQYPSFNLSASVETSALSVNNLFDDWLANFAANAIQPVFDGDLRKLEVERQEAIVLERIHTWGQTILDALEEIEAALTREKQQTLYLESLKLQLELALETYERNRERYIKGQVDYIRVLESLQSLQTLERNVVTAQRMLIGYRIDLYRSIAGSFELPQPTLTDLKDLTGTMTESENIIHKN